MTHGYLKIMFCILVIFCMAVGGQAQTDKRITQAEKYYKAGEYYTAALLYGQFLTSSRTRQAPVNFPLTSKRHKQSTAGLTDDAILYRQAESYRLANYWNEAATLYQQYYQIDSIKNIDALYWVAVCQRSLGNYKDAEKNLRKLIGTGGTNGPNEQITQRELETLSFIQAQLTRPDSVLFHISKTQAQGADKGLYAAAPLSAGRFFSTSSAKDSITRPGENPFHNRLFSSSMEESNWSALEPVMIDSLDLSLNQGTASISTGGRYLYFTQWSKEKGSAIYYSARQESGWGKPRLLSAVNQDGFNSKQPFCSADGKYLFFSSDMPGGAGKFDIWYATLAEDGSAHDAVNLGNTVNTPEDEQAPFYQGSGSTLVFSTNGRPGMGGFDLFSTIGFEKEWNVPENLGHPVNSSRDDLYFFTAENNPLLSQAILGSDRGSDCCIETYVISKDPKKKFLSGQIQDCASNEPLPNVEVTLKDGSGKSWSVRTGGDGKYEFDLTGVREQQTISVSRELYKDITDDVTVVAADESGWLTDMLTARTVCLEKNLVIKPENVVTVFFDFDKSDLKERALAVLDSIYNVLMEDTAATIQVSGYTDGLGTVEYNKKLSDRRASACAAYLIAKGIDPARISFESFGACCPIEMEIINGRDNAEGRSRNRRALINISKSE